MVVLGGGVVSYERGTPVSIDPKPLTPKPDTSDAPNTTKIAASGELRRRSSPTTSEDPATFALGIGAVQNDDLLQLIHQVRLCPTRVGDRVSVCERGTGRLFGQRERVCVRERECVCVRERVCVCERESVGECV